MYSYKYLLLTIWYESFLVGKKYTTYNFVYFCICCTYFVCVFFLICTKIYKIISKFNFDSYIDISYFISFYVKAFYFIKLSLSKHWINTKSDSKSDLLSRAQFVQCSLSSASVRKCPQRPKQSFDLWRCALY